MLSPLQKEKIRKAHFELPAECRNLPASEPDLLRFEQEFEATIPEDYRWYLSECGGGVIGREWIDGIEQLAESHRRFREGAKGGLYSLENFFIVGWDGSGNPCGFDLENGKILTEDHDFGGIHVMANCFFSLLERVGLFGTEDC